MNNSLTNKIKASLLHYYNFERQAKLSATEVYTIINSIGDVVIIDKSNNVIEVEIKISINDLKHELDKGDKIYEWDKVKGKQIILIRNKHILIRNNNYISESPNKYYFCVPESILKETLEFALKLNPRYGVLLFNENHSINKNIKVVKKALSLHKNDNSNIYSKRIIDRMSNDITKCYRLLYWR